MAIRRGDQASIGGLSASSSGNFRESGGWHLRTNLKNMSSKAADGQNLRLISTKSLTVTISCRRLGPLVNHVLESTLLFTSGPLLTPCDTACHSLHKRSSSCSTKLLETIMAFFEKSASAVAGLILDTMRIGNRRAIAPDVGNQGSHMLRLVLSFPIFLCLGGTSQHGIILFRANERTCQAFGLRSRESRIWSLQACCAVVLGAANGVDDRKIVIYLITHFVDCNSSKAEATTGSAKLLNCSKEATVAAIDAAAGPATIQKSFAPYTQSKSPTCHHHPVIFARWGRAGKWHAFLPFAPGESLQAKLYQRVATTPDA